MMLNVWYDTNYNPVKFIWININYINIMAHTMTEEILKFLNICKLSNGNDVVRNETMPTMIYYAKEFMSNNKPIQSMLLLRKWYDIFYSNPYDLMETIGPFIVEILDGYDQKLHDNPTLIHNIAQIVLPEYGIRIPWSVNTNNVNMYRKLVIFGFRPIIEPVGDMKLLERINDNIDRWVNGSWTNIESIESKFLNLKNTNNNNKSDYHEKNNIIPDMSNLKLN